MNYNKKISTINLLFLLSILLPSYAKRVLFVSKVVYGIEKRKDDPKQSVKYGSYPIDANRYIDGKDVTDKFFNRSGDNWMNELFGDPASGKDKKLSIKYSKINKEAWEHNNIKLKTIEIPEGTKLNLEESNDQFASKVELPNANTVYAIEYVAYETTKKTGSFEDKAIIGTYKFGNRTNNNKNWMNDTFGDPFEGKTKKLYIKYGIVDTDAYAITQPSTSKILSEDSPINGL